MASIDQAKRKAIREALIEHAEEGRFPYYGELGAPLRIHPRWPLWKLYLDSISREERSKGRPDITWIVRTARTKLPGQMDFERVEKPTQAHWDRARDMVQPVIDLYCPGTPNPYDRRLVST